MFPNRLLLIIFIMMIQAWLVTAQSNVNSMEYDGAERTYYVHVPDTYSVSEPMPLVLALHDFASSGRGMAAMTGLDAVADGQGFIVAYPDALDMYWDDGRVRRGWPPNVDEVDDVGFLTQMLDDLTTQYNVGEVYLTGYANGGTMAYRLACELPNRFAAVAVVGALMWDYHLDDCAASDAPVTMLVMLGTADVSYPLAGRTVTLAGGDVSLEILDAQATIDYWVGHNECDLDTAQIVDDILVYDTCSGGTRVVFDPLAGVGHVWLRDGDYTLNQFGMDATEAIAGFFFGNADWVNLSVPDTSAEIFGDLTRSYRAYVPTTYDPQRLMPLVIALHGRPDNGTGFAYRLDMNRVAQQHGFIMAYPDGIDFGWNYVKGSPLFAQSSVDDDAFLEAMVDDLAVDLNIDRDRVYVTGFSNGGFMTMRLACVAPDLYAGFAIVGAGFQINFVDLCREATPVPMMFMHGTEDVSIPWAGMVTNEIRALLSFPDTVGMWVDVNRCDGDPVQAIFPQSGQSPETQVHRFNYTNCAEPGDLLVYAIVGGGHNLPGVPGRIIERIAGRVNMDIHAGEVIWEFLSEHSLSE